MRISRRVLAGAALAACLVIPSSSFADFGSGSFKGKRPPELKITKWLNGDPLSLGELQGKVVLLEFFATW